MKRREMLLSSLENDDIGRWADIKAAMGDIVSSDNKQKLVMFHLDRMRNPEVSVGKRIESREYLAQEKVVKIKDEPITVFDHLERSDFENFTFDRKRFSIRGKCETIFLFDQQIVMNKFFMYFQQAYGKDIDVKRSSVVRLELWTLNNEHIKFLKMHAIYPLPPEVPIRWAFIYYYV